MANVRDLLEAHQKELSTRLDGLRSQLIPLERELADVRRAISALSDEPRQQHIVFPSPSGAADSHEVAWRQRLVSQQSLAVKSPYQALTIKELILKALREQFKDGATAGELLEFFRNAWARVEIVRTSLSPQLSRLKQENQIRLDRQRWYLNNPREEMLSKAATDP